MAASCAERTLAAAASMVAIGLAALSCSGGAHGAGAAAPPKGTSGPVESAASSRNEPPGGFVSRFGREHPLVGRIFAPASRAEIDRASLVAKLATARFVLLGEQHDNPDHHRLQAALVEELVRAGRRPAVAFEMFETSQQAALDAYRSAPGANAEGLGPALDFEHSGWPPWKEYQPIAEVAFAAGLRIVAANLPRAEARELVHQTGEAEDGATLARLGIGTPLAPPLDASLRSELAASHCGQLPESMVGGMVLAQRARDAAMARSLADAARAAGGANGAVLITGAGHARKDRGVPLYLRAADPNASIATIAFVEIDPERADPSSYAARYHAEQLPFDFVWFTPVASDEDPCAKFRSSKK